MSEKRELKKRPYMSEKYGPQVDLIVPEARVKMSETNEVKILMGHGIEPLDLPEKSAMYGSLIEKLYGPYMDLIVPEVTVKLSKKNHSIRIFMKHGIKPLYLPRKSAMYESLIEIFND